ncbi:hypothetical protein [Frankia tisae]|uniref:hypothetical protein n=1 Tax=Frankia tisae TaxID=2950104 RepID=UPI0021C161E7|nr:hypothetical protein [Frankia tisae]
MPTQNTPPRRTAPAGKTTPPAKPAAGRITPTPLVDQISRLAEAVENASDPGRLQRDTAAKVDDLAGQVRKIRVAGLRARREALATKVNATRQARRESLRARRAELLARPLPPSVKAAGGKGKASTAVRSSTVPSVPARKTLPRRSGR